MKARLAFLAIFLLAGSVRLAATTDETAVVQARSMLPESLWSRAVTIQNDVVTKQFPRMVHALVFELADRLWLYIPSAGTQGLSIYKNHADKDKQTLLPLLQRIHSGFTALTQSNATNVNKPETPSRTPLPNGCFIECAAQYARLLRESTAVADARLFMCYYATSKTGHCILFYKQAGEAFVYDPASDSAPHPLYQSSLHRLFHDRGDSLVELVGTIHTLNHRPIPSRTGAIPLATALGSTVIASDNQKHTAPATTSATAYARTAASEKASL